ncbi:RNA-directed DNA polymerase, eukaryota, reverse transcriptase zinc-binding domain protein [Tanacetum coccineum]|uniref:RNA-directed DNA polymerase, eukaryota, reverse transcriptase zinc-binding domain protein n=1 Tax=Tanacetum coccineum TaxID=301880 RepID=A0ABQ5B1Y6_9ASTR
MRNQRQSKVPLRFEDTIHNINNSKANKKKTGSKKKEHEIYKESGEGNRESRLSKGAYREDRVKISNSDGNVGSKGLNDEENNKELRMNLDDVQNNLDSWVIVIDVDSAFWMVIRGVYGNANKEEIEVQTNTAFDCNTPNCTMSNDMSNEEKHKENLGAKNNEGLPKQNMNSYASMVKMDDVPKNLEFIPTVVTGIEVVIFDEDLVQKGEKMELTVFVVNLLGMRCILVNSGIILEGCGGKYGIDEIDKGKNGQYMFKFKDDKGMNTILEKGPWMVKGKPLFVQKWSPEIGMTKVEPKKLPVWVKIIHVPLEAWSVKGISVLASGLGTPIVMDSMTASMCHRGIGNLSYARVLVEMDATKELKNEIEIQYVDKNKNVKGSKKVQVVYDWKPPSCSHCKVFGHDIRKCKNGGVVNNNNEGVQNVGTSVLMKHCKEPRISITRDMIDYFKTRWEEDRQKESEDTTAETYIEDVLEVNTGTAKVIGDNEISAQMKFLERQKLYGKELIKGKHSDKEDKRSEDCESLFQSRIGEDVAAKMITNVPDKEIK